MASATEYSPNSQGPPLLPKRDLQFAPDSSMRSMSASSAGVMGVRRFLAFALSGHSARRLAKPECISAHTEPRDGPGGGVHRPAPARELGDVFANRERIPNGQLAVQQHRYPPRGAVAADLIFILRGIER